MDRSRSRPHRTFIGARCAVCEEPLEHTLRGERVLQFSCAHVSHEACFYEYIKEADSHMCPECNLPLGLDSSRGGNVLDLEKLSSIVRSVSVADNIRNSGRETPTQREQDRTDKETISSVQYDNFDNRMCTPSRPDSSLSRSDIGGPTARYDDGHRRNDSSVSDMDPGPPGLSARRHDYDVHSMESELSPRNSVTNPIPPPTVNVKSEFPTLNRSKTQQTLTCLVTLEVAERKWHNFADDIACAARLSNYDQQYRTPSPAAGRSQYSYDKMDVLSVRQRERELANEQEILGAITDELHQRVENWHGLDFNRFGKLRLHGTIKVGKDLLAWQELECYLFSEMLICVKDKKLPAGTSSAQWANGGSKKKAVKCTLKGSILIRKHLKKVTDSSGLEDHILTLNLSVAELPQFHLSFLSHANLDQWKRALLDMHSDTSLGSPIYEDKHSSNSDMDEDECGHKITRRVSSAASNCSGTHGGARSIATAATEYSTTSTKGRKIPRSVHIPLDIVVVIPVSSSMQGLKINLLRDSLKFLVHNLGERDRLGLVTFGSSGGGVPLTGLTTKAWTGWPKVIASIRPVGQKSLRADVVEGANVAMDLLMQRKSSNPIGSILLISDSSTLETEAVDFVVSRAEAAKITIHSFGLGLTHKPDTMIELSTRTKGLFTYVKDWMMLRECVAGCVGSLQSLSHQNAKLKLKLPEGSPARFVKISGALHVSKRASGREAEVSLGDLRFGDKKDVLVQLVIAPDTSQTEQAPQDAWESIVSGLEALGGSMDHEDQRVMSVEEVPLIQADLSYGDIQRDGTLSQSRPHLLTITMLPPSNSKNTGRPGSPPIPPHPMVVQRRMELLTSDMLSRALTLVSRTQHDRAQTLLKETRTILRGLGKGGLPPLPPPPSSNLQIQNNTDNETQSHSASPPSLENNFSSAAGIDSTTVASLDAELESALEWINHPAVFSRDSRKAVLQAIGVISSQRGVTFRTACESLYANRIVGVRKLSHLAREWRDVEESLAEEE